MNNSLSHKEFSVRYNRVMKLLDDHLISKKELEPLIQELWHDSEQLIKYSLREQIDELEDRILDRLGTKVFWTVCTIALVLKFFDLMFQLY